ncbi:AN1-type zinc finger protein 4 [Phytophthora boehmeriae]|uniref:AN1-type zinc finger protein 4 n=1 Tax=Phytophthora boehmeriae TaxID=109152 RepID=A0A8T1X0T8_9STRA|nr:AN1-type zinc finger protein 4 [Phytophthora boehmeriae]
MVTKATTSSSASSDAPVSAASASPTTSTSPTVVAPAPPTTTDCLKAPGPSSPSSVDTSPDTDKTQRYPRVPPAVLQSVKASLTFRKSCLKRSKSTVLPPTAVSSDETKVKAPLTDHNAPTENKRPVQKNRRRCWECKKKVGLTAVTCRCDYTFCDTHRYAEEHSCAFNFKTAGKRKLEAENPLVIPRKVARIN